MKKLIYTFISLLFAFVAANAETAAKAKAQRLTKSFPHPNIDFDFAKARYMRKRQSGPVKIALVFMNVGMYANATRKIIELAPSGVNYAYTPYAQLQSFEVRLLKKLKVHHYAALPLETYHSDESPQDPLRLRRGMPRRDLMMMFRNVMNRMPFDVEGVVICEPSPCTKTKIFMQQFAEIMKSHFDNQKKLFINSETTIDQHCSELCTLNNMPTLQLDYAFHGYDSIDKIRTLFVEIESLGQQTGIVSLGIDVNPLNVDETIKWLESLRLGEYEFISLTEYHKYVSP